MQPSKERGRQKLISFNELWWYENTISKKLSAFCIFNRAFEWNSRIKPVPRQRWEVVLCGSDEFFESSQNCQHFFHYSWRLSRVQKRTDSKTQTHSFIVHRSTLRCSNLVVSLLNETQKTGSCIYRAYRTEFSKHSFIKGASWYNRLLLSTVELIPDEKRKLSYHYLRFSLGFPLLVVITQHISLIFHDK